MGFFSGIKDAVGGITGGILGTGGAAAAGKATDAQIEALTKAIEEYRSGYAGQEGLWNPLRDFGMGAIGGLNALNKGDYSGFESSPDYLFALQQGNQALGQNQAARGNLFSGGAGRELAQYNQGLASQQLGQYRNALFNQLNFGQSATNALSNALTNKTQGIVDARIGAGNARASGYTGAANAYTGAANNLMNFAGNVTGAAGQAGGFGNLFNFSDRRLKSNIKRIGTHSSGLPWYSYEIFGQPSEGVMADEVAAVRPEAVKRHGSGYLMVNYAAL